MATKNAEIRYVFKNNTHVISVVGFMNNETQVHITFIDKKTIDGVKDDNVYFPFKIGHKYGDGELIDFAKAEGSYSQALTNYGLTKAFDGTEEDLADLFTYSQTIKRVQVNQTGRDPYYMIYFNGDLTSNLESGGRFTNSELSYQYLGLSYNSETNETVCNVFNVVSVPAEGEVVVFQTENIFGPCTVAFSMIMGQYTIIYTGGDLSSDRGSNNYVTINNQDVFINGLNYIAEEDTTYLAVTGTIPNPANYWISFKTIQEQGGLPGGGDDGRGGEGIGR
jgi:hypothetical protein